VIASNIAHAQPVTQSPDLQPHHDKLAKDNSERVGKSKKDGISGFLAKEVFLALGSQGKKSVPEGKLSKAKTPRKAFSRGPLPIYILALCVPVLPI
jgi:hypothetical protein